MPEPAKSCTKCNTEMEEGFICRLWPLPIQAGRVLDCRPSGEGRLIGS
jgi:hypothetical protein